MSDVIQVIVFLVVAAVVIWLFVRKGKQTMREDS